MRVALRSNGKSHGNISASQLNDIRINNSCRCRIDNKDKVCETHTFDELIENANFWKKILPLGSDQKCWVDHSPNVMVARSCLNFVKHECGQGLIYLEAVVNYNDELKPQNHDHSKHGEQRCNSERSRLFKMFQKNHYH